MKKYRKIGGPFICELCNFPCAQKIGLKKHMSIKHPEKELIKCTECKFSAIQDSDLTLHVKAKHSSDRPFTCARCDETFKRKSHLQVHLVTHGEKPFKCQYCE